MRLIDRTALVTGASRGIGRAIALALAAEGADVAVNYLCSETPAKQLVKEIEEMGRQALLVQGDVGNYDDACRMAQEIGSAFGHLDILINNAGITSDRSFSKMDQADWRKVMTTNLDGVFNCTKVFIDGMMAQGWGRVVNVTSVIGQIGNFGQVNYASSKAGVAAFTKSLGQGGGGEGHHGQRHCPGFHRNGNDQHCSREDPHQVARANSHAAFWSSRGSGPGLCVSLFSRRRLHYWHGVVH